MKIYKEDAFTLLEVIIATALMSLILFVLLNINLTGFKFWDINQKNIELSQSVNVITANLDERIRKSSVSNVSGSWKNELIINIGEKGSNNKDNYLRFVVQNNRLVLQKLNNNVTLNSSNLPSGAVWENVKTISDSIIKENSFLVKKEQDTITYQMELINDNRNFELSTNIKPRL